MFSLFSLIYRIARGGKIIFFQDLLGETPKILILSKIAQVLGKLCGYWSED